MKHLTLGLAVALALGISSRDCWGQAVISAGVSETYDDNIFLESGRETPSIIVPGPDPGSPGTSVAPPEELDGKKNDDFLTGVQFGLSGAPSLIRGAQTTMGATVGGIFFADQTDFNRLTLNSDLAFHSTKDLIPEPFYVDAESLILSQSNDATIAQGTATRLTQVHYATLDAGVRNIGLAPQLSWGAGYRLGYTDYLGDFAFQDPSDDVTPALQNRVENRGSDFLTNSVSTVFDHQTTRQLTLSAGAAVNVVTFTKVESSSGAELDRGQLDRNEFVPSVQTRYQLNKDFSFDASAGYNFTRYHESADSNLVVTDTNGTPLDNVSARSDSQDSFIFQVGAGYAPDLATNYHLSVNQSTTPDLNGNRLITRAVTLLGVQKLTDRVRGSASGRYLEFDTGQSLQNATKRFEFTLALQYSLTPSIALNTGWTYSDQNEDDDRTNPLLSSGDYEVNRFFVGLSAGFIGLMN